MAKRPPNWRVQKEQAAKRQNDYDGKGPANRKPGDQNLEAPVTPSPLSERGVASIHYNPGTSVSDSTKVTRTNSFHDAVGANDTERLRQRAMGRNQRLRDTSKTTRGLEYGEEVSMPGTSDRTKDGASTGVFGDHERRGIPGQEVIPQGAVPSSPRKRKVTSDTGMVIGETTKRGLGAKLANPDQAAKTYKESEAKAKAESAAKDKRVRVNPRAAGTTEGPGGGVVPGTPGGRATLPAPKRTKKAAEAEARIGAQNPNVTSGSLEELSKEERSATRKAAKGRKSPGTRRRSGGGSAPDLSSMTTADTSVERGKTSAARARARTGEGKSPVNPAAESVAREVTTSRKAKAADKFLKESTAKAEAVEAGATDVKPAVLEPVKAVVGAEMIGTKEYHLARASEALGHPVAHIESFLRSKGLPIDQGAKGLYDLVHRETKGQQTVTKGSEAAGTLREEPKKKAVTVVSRNGKSFYEKGTGNGTPALEAVGNQITDHVATISDTRKEARKNKAAKVLGDALDSASQAKK